MVTGKFALQIGFYPCKYFAGELWQARWNDNSLYPVAPDKPSLGVLENY
jgi:hypothetical protein